MSRGLVLVMAAGVGLGCSGAKGSAYRSELQSAQATWATTKPSCTSYHYGIHSSSVFGSCSTTTIEIANDQPVWRGFVAFMSGSCNSPDAGPSNEWVEADAQQVGTHPDGAPALTVEQLFAACQTSLTSDPSTNHLTFAVGPDGVPTACGVTPSSCLDDCFVGFFLSDFACGPLSADAGAGAPPA